MSDDRATQIWLRIVARARREGSAPSPRHACLACVHALPLDGAALVLARNHGVLEPLSSSDPRSGEVEQLQATAGQGPGMDALALGRPMLVADLASGAQPRRWPLFVPEARKLGVRAMYSLPLALGAVRVGVLDLFRDAPGELTSDQLFDALIYADTALLLVLNAMSDIPVDGAAGETGTVLWHAEVHQAAAMVSARLGIPALDALVLLRTHANRHGLRLTETARSVVAHRLQLHAGDARR